MHGLMFSTFLVHPPFKEMVLNRDDRSGEIFARGLKSAAGVACHWSVRLHPYSSIIIMAVWVVGLVSLSMPLQKKKTFVCQLRVVVCLLSSAAGTSHSRGRPAEAGHQMTHFTQ